MRCGTSSTASPCRWRTRRPRRHQTGQAAPATRTCSVCGAPARPSMAERDREARPGRRSSRSRTREGAVTPRRKRAWHRRGAHFASANTDGRERSEQRSTPEGGRLRPRDGGRGAGGGPKSSAVVEGPARESHRARNAERRARCLRQGAADACLDRDAAKRARRPGAGATEQRRRGVKGARAWSSAKPGAARGAERPSLHDNRRESAHRPCGRRPPGVCCGHEESNIDARPGARGRAPRVAARDRLPGDCRFRESCRRARPGGVARHVERGPRAGASFRRRVAARGDLRRSPLGPEGSLPSTGVTHRRRGEGRRRDRGRARPGS